MEGNFFLVIGILFVVCVNPVKLAYQTINYSGLDQAGRDFLIQGHNAARLSTALGQIVGGNGSYLPSAADMTVMDYNMTIENHAQNWTNGCVYAHGGYATYNEGQNIAYANNTDIFASAMTGWYNKEAAIYNFGDQVAGTGHYTQIVWSQSTQVGCGLKTCYQLGNTPSGGYFMTCNFYARGNIIRNNLKIPYIIGPPCSQCPAGYTQCWNGGLCATPAQCSSLGGSCTASKLA